MHSMTDVSKDNLDGTHGTVIENYDVWRPWKQTPMDMKKQDLDSLFINNK